MTSVVITLDFLRNSPNEYIFTILPLQRIINTRLQRVIWGRTIRVLKVGSDYDLQSAVSNYSLQNDI